MSIDTTCLFAPLTVRNKILRNRIVMPPMVTNRSIVDDDGITWYSEHAVGMGLVVVEATAVQRFGEDLKQKGLERLTAPDMKTCYSQQTF